MSASDRRALVGRGAASLSIRRQCVLLGVARSGVYRVPRPANDSDLALLLRIDELYLAWPFLGSRRMTALLRAKGHPVNRKRVQRLMRRMGIAAGYMGRRGGMLKMRSKGIPFAPSRHPAPHTWQQESRLARIIHQVA